MMILAVGFLVSSSQKEYFEQRLEDTPRITPIDH
jgi:hypothetical protein